MDLVVPVAQSADPEVAKAAFQIDLQAQTATCPQGHSVAGQPCQDAAGRPILSFNFARGACEACPLFARCVRSKILGRTVRTNAHEDLLQAARSGSRRLSSRRRTHCVAPSSAKGPNWYSTAYATPATWASASGSSNGFGSAPRST